ncbi:hypothetical protein LOD99_12799 [Oopsacas minuta]|uniref:PH domain-containing protein n=1 Tax=Oopsacas minuta TaxID=111878 RepID=A0AAV7JD09_9METZ|nr:hypothetical protein LOD99_12799 [Oopsacas minuta]
MVSSLEIYPTQSDTINPINRILFISFKSCTYKAIQVMGNYKNQANSFQIKTEGITYTLATEDGGSLHEWITAIHANIRPSNYNIPHQTQYCSINDIEINPDFTLFNGEESKNSTPTSNSPKHLKARRKSSNAADKFKSIFKYKKNNKKDKGKGEEKACSDTELRNPSPPNLEELYSKINRKTKLRKSLQFEMRIDSPDPENRFEVKPYMCHSDPTYHFNSVDGGIALRGKTKRLKTRSERGSGRRSQPDESSSEDESKPVPQIPKKLSITTPTELTGPHPVFLFPPPPSRSPSDLSEMSPRIKASPMHLTLTSPKVKPRNTFTKQSPSIVNNPQFEFQTSIDNSILLPEHEITTIKLKTNSSSGSETDEMTSPPTRDDVTLVHPKKRLSVSSPPSSARDLETSFLFSDKDTLTTSLPIKQSEQKKPPPVPPYPQALPKVVTKKVSGVNKSKQPYVNLPQLVRTSEVLPNGGRTKFREATESVSSDNTQVNPPEISSHTDSPQSVKININLKQTDKQLPPRPAKPPTLPPKSPNKSTLKSNLKQPQFYNSISSTASSNGLSTSKDSQDLDSNCSSRPRGLKVNFGGTTEIPITPNTNAKKRPDSNNYTYGYPNSNNASYQGFNSYVEFSVPYGSLPQHGHFPSDPHFRQVMVPAPFYYPSSVHIPSMSMMPTSFDNLMNESLPREIAEYNHSHTPSYEYPEQYNAPFVGYNSAIPYYTSPPPFTSYSTDPNINELRSRAYSAYSGEYYQSHSLKTKPYKPSRPAPAPPKTPPNSKVRAVPITNINKVTGNTETMV